MTDNVPFAVDDSLPDFDPRQAVKDLELQRWNEAAKTPFSLGVAQGRPGAPPTQFFENPGWMPQDHLKRVHEAVEPVLTGSWAHGVAKDITTAGFQGKEAWDRWKLSPLMDAATTLAPTVLGAIVPMAPKGVHGMPLPENAGIPRAMRPGIKERPVRPEPLAPELDNGFYLTGMEALRNTQRRNGTADAWLKELEKAGTKQSEMEAVGLRDFFAGNPNPTRDELLRHYQENRPRLQTTNYGAMPPKDDAAMRAEFAPLAEERERLVAERGPPRQYGVGPSPEAFERQQRIQELTTQINAIKDKYKPAADIKWKRFNGQNLSLNPENPSNREVVAHSPVPPGKLQLGEAGPFGELSQGISNPNGDAMWQGRVPVKGVTETPFRIGQEEGYITHWPEGFRRGPLGEVAVEGPTHVVNSTNMQNAHFKTLEEAQAAIERSYNEPSGLLARQRSDVYREPHFPDVPGYLFHLRSGMYRDAEGKLQFHIDENQSTRAQAIRDAEGPKDPAKIAELQKRIDEADSKLGTLYDQAEAHIKQVAAERGQPKIVDEVIGNRMGPGREYQIRNMLLAMAPGGKPPQHQLHSIRDAAAAVGPAADKHRQTTMDLLDNISAWHENRDLAHAEHRAANDAPHGDPFVNNMSQTNLTSLRLAIKEAVDSGVAGITMTPGSLQNQRYGLSSHAQALRYDPETKELHYIPADNSQYGRFRDHPRRGPGEWRSLDGQHEAHELPGLIGKEAAAKLLAQPRAYYGVNGSVAGGHVLEGKGLEIGGQGMKDYYDRQYPKTLNKELERLAKKGGGSYPGQGEKKLYNPTSEDPRRTRSGYSPMHHFPLTPEIIEQVKKGLPLFSAAGLMALVPQIKQKPTTSEDNPFGYE